MEACVIGDIHRVALLTQQLHFPLYLRNLQTFLNEIFNTFNGIYGCFVFVNFITFDNSKDTRIVCLVLTVFKDKESQNSHAGSNINVEYHKSLEIITSS